jgi:hypothetical protein
LILRVVSASGGSAHRLPVMVNWSNYLTWCGGNLVFTAGSDRVAIHHKQLDVAGPPDWRARPLVHAPGRAWGALACAPDQRSVVVQSQRQSQSANFYAPRWQLWRVSFSGPQTQLTSPPAGHADESPRFSRNGRTATTATRTGGPPPTGHSPRRTSSRLKGCDLVRTRSRPGPNQVPTRSGRGPNQVEVSDISGAYAVSSGWSRDRRATRACYAGSVSRSASREASAV